MGTVPDSAVLAAWRDRYDESLLYLDHQIGVLLDSLAARHLLDHTIVIVTGDHGESFGEHGTVHHGATLYLEQIRVPLILWGPGLIPAGREVDRRLTRATGYGAGGCWSAGRGSASLASPPLVPLIRPPSRHLRGSSRPGNPPTWQTERAGEIGRDPALAPDPV
jgi:hypothetical protein